VVYILLMKSKSRTSKKTRSESEETLWDEIAEELNRPHLKEEIGAHLHKMTIKQKAAFLEKIRNQPDFLLDYEREGEQYHSADIQCFEHWCVWVAERLRQNVQHWKRRLQFWRKNQ